MSLSGSIYGRLGGDPEVKQTQDGKNYAQFSVAVDYGKNTDGGKKTYWVTIKAYGNQGKLISESFKKGHRIKCDLKQIEISPYNDNNGNARAGVYAQMTDFDYVETKDETQGSSHQNNNSGNQQQGQNNMPAPPSQPPAQNNGGWGNQSQPPQPQYNQPPNNQPPQQNYAASPWG